MHGDFIPIPTDSQMLPLPAQTAALAFNAIMVGLALLYLVSRVIKRGDLVPIYVLMGSIAAILYEPLADHLVMVYFPPQGQITSLEALGRKVPLYLHLAYIWYLAPFAVYFLERAKRPISAPLWWTAAGLILALAIAFEEVFIHFGLWQYYGEQPFRLIQTPLWIPFTFVCFVFAIATGVYGLVNFTARRHHWLIMPAVPMLITGSHTATTLPAATAINSTQDPLLLYAGASASIALSILFIWALSLFFVAQKPPG